MHFSGAFALKGFGAKASTEVREQWTWPSFCGRCCTSDTEVREGAANYCMITGKHQNSHFRQREQYRWLLWPVCSSRRSRTILRQRFSHSANFIYFIFLSLSNIFDFYLTISCNFVRLDNSMFVGAIFVMWCRKEGIMQEKEKKVVGS